LAHAGAWSATSIAVVVIETLTEPAMQSDQIRRNPDGAIDYDFYRAKAATLRLQMWRDCFSNARRIFAKSLMAAAAKFNSLPARPVPASLEATTEMR
jgi:hypothetical protein